MMQQELVFPPWPSFNATDLTNDHMRFYYPQMKLYSHDFWSLYTNPDESSVISTQSNLPVGFPDEFSDLPVFMDGVENTSSLGDFEPVSSDLVEDIYGWLNESDSEGNFSVSCQKPIKEVVWSPCFSMESSENSMEMSLQIPRYDDEIENNLSLYHLLKAYGEAKENGHSELAEVIVRCINKKASPLGDVLEHVAFNLLKSKQNQADYLRQESGKNYVPAFKLCYQMLPNGKFAHFAANLAILESIPSDTEILHIIDFAMGEGIQWLPVLEPINQKQISLRLTSITSEGKCSSTHWNFEDTKNRLLVHARQCNLRLEVEEKSLEEVKNEIMWMKTQNRGRRWIVFNCMFNLPHMGRRQGRDHILQFLETAKELLVFSGPYAGIVTFGDGEAGKSFTSYPGYSSFFDNLLRHYHAVFESVEWSFPTYLAQARIAFETLFLAPYLCPESWFRDWDNSTRVSNLMAGTGLQGWKISEETLREAKQIANVEKSPYSVEIEEQKEHEMVLAWRGTPIVRFSTWT